MALGTSLAGWYFRGDGNFVIGDNGLLIVHDNSASIFDTGGSFRPPSGLLVQGDSRTARCIRRVSVILRYILPKNKD